MDRHGSYIRNAHGFKMSSSKYTVETISPCVKQNGKNTSFSMSHIFGKKRTIPNLFILAYYSLSSTVSILFNLMLRLYIYTGQCNIGSSSNFNIQFHARRVFRKQYLFSCLHFEMICTFTSGLPYKGQLKWRIFLIFQKIALCVHKLRVADSFRS